MLICPSCRGETEAPVINKRESWLSAEEAKALQECPDEKSFRIGIQSSLFFGFLPACLTDVARGGAVRDGVSGWYVCSDRDRFVYFIVRAATSEWHK